MAIVPVSTMMVLGPVSSYFYSLSGNGFLMYPFLYYVFVAVYGSMEFDKRYGADLPPSPHFTLSKYILIYPPLRFFQFVFKNKL